MGLELGLAKKRVLITASTKGIGYAAAKAFLTNGSRVVVSSSNEENVRAAVSSLSALGEVYGYKADIRLKEDVEGLVGFAVAKLGGLDVLVYVAGSPPPGVFMEKTYEDWDEASRLLVLSATYIAKLTAQQMISQGSGGSMVFLSSYVIKEPAPNLALSDVCRISIAGLVRTLARELGPMKIRVNGVMPGYIATQRVEEVLRDTAKRLNTTPQRALEELQRRIPLGYVGKPEELANVVLFLASNMSSYVTGAMIPVDGGILNSVF
ncbi:MAG: SDR family oxidoreductase [Thermoprotei archaeon]